MMQHGFTHSSVTDNASCVVKSIVHNQSCNYTMTKYGELDAVAVIRLVTSMLGLIGSLTIIISAVVRRRVFSSEVHPIFMLSLADCFLDILWIIGSSFWLANDLSFNRQLCYPVTVLTAIFECAAVNLTVVYAVIAYYRVKRTELQALLLNTTLKPADIGRCKVFLFYLLAWVSPAVMILVAFLSSAFNTPMLSATQNCTCWCRPTVINVLPFDGSESTQTHKYMQSHFPFLISSGTIVSFHYVYAFFLLLYVYIRILRHIRKIKQEHDAAIATNRYGATGAMLRRGHSQARKRVWLFLSVFVISGFFNLCCSITLVALLSRFYIKTSESHSTPLMLIYFIFLYAQSVTLPLQGFLNAIVYGWTRGDFVSAVTLRLNQTAEEENQIVSGDNSYEESTEHPLSRSSSRSRTSLINEEDSDD